MYVVSRISLSYQKLGKHLKENKHSGLSGWEGLDGNVIPTFNIAIKTLSTETKLKRLGIIHLAAVYKTIRLHFA